MVTHLVPDAVSILSLALMGIQDIRRKSISAWIIIIYIIFGALYGLINNSLTDVVFSAIPGALLALLAFITREKIGYGDGLISLGLGFWMGTEMVVTVIASGILVIGAYSTVYTIVGLCKKTKIDVNKQVPFVPFLLGGLVVSIVYFETN